MITVITIAHKSNSTLPRYISSFIKHHQSCGDATNRIEFIFVENSGMTDIEELVQPLIACRYKVSILRSPNKGFAHACNLASKESLGDVIFLVNPDVVFCTSILELDNASPYSWGTVLQRSNKIIPYSFDLLPEFKSFITEILFAHHAINIYCLMARGVPRVCYAIGASLFLTSDLINRSDLFDERFFLYYEEAELCRRLSLGVGPATYIRSIITCHAQFGSASSLENTFKLEAQGFLTYCNVINDKSLPYKRLSTLRKMSIFSSIARKRLAALKIEIANYETP
jgi:GT2 family glycosyltransferase